MVVGYSTHGEMKIIHNILVGKFKETLYKT
jgi:hypothetical protein